MCVKEHALVEQKAYCIQVASPDEETVLRQTSEGTSFHSLLFRRSSSGGDHGRGETADEDRSEDSVSTPKETGGRTFQDGGEEGFTSRTESQPERLSPVRQKQLVNNHPSQT
ncbi:m168 [Muromegalovirus WP15B]|uniref:M168 n=2 Tax=Murid herpesvirus 1 TaxID=10366 RepID=B3UY96_MUHV1|nr:m168 [Muromegalovirus WP15B]ACE95671.1 m168 [Muromegalovirus C4A]